MASINRTRVNQKRKMPPLIENSPCEKKTKSTKNDEILQFLGLSHQQFHLLFDNLPHGVSVNKIFYNRNVKPVNFVKIASNPAYRKLNPRKCIWRDVAPRGIKIKKVAIDWLGIFSRVALTGKAEIFEVYSKSRDKWYRINVFSPKKSYFFCIYIDVTKDKKYVQDKNIERARTLSALILTEKRYRRLYETTQDGIMARDLNGKMIDCNQAYAKMLGFTKKELKEKTVQELLPEKWHDQRDKIIQKVLRTGRSILFEREYKRKDNSVFSASVRTWRLTDGKGKVIGTWSIIRDISEQKKHQKSLEYQADLLQKIVEERTKQLKDSERLATIGQTAGMVGHDLRNPLQTVIGELFLAKSEVDGLTQSEARKNLSECMQAIEDQVTYMNKIVSDLQAFVQPVKIDKKAIDLKELIEGVILSVPIPDNISVQLHIQKGLPQVKADLQLLRRVLINLITNAVQAMPNGGDLDITGDINAERRVYVTVRDTGVGISEIIKNKIFTPLFTTKSRGQGFGLAVCRRVMEAHGGTISFESTEGKGAAFTIQFPVG